MNLQFRSSLDENLPFHLKADIDLDDMKMLANALKDYLLSSPVIEKHNSCTLTTALEKLVTIVGGYAEAEEARKKAMSGFYRNTNTSGEPKSERASSVKSAKKSLIMD
ncbi:GL24031 [Drosophila persimilis]|uniref:GL24031 n=2 Tax=Drosophila persimilis TaxID=7234 RepID=B4G345_DROPE|nr:GL24031 [Drosophila persimilis]